jgi:hypothetical protein
VAGAATLCGDFTLLVLIHGSESSIARIVALIGHFLPPNRIAVNHDVRRDRNFRRADPKKFRARFIRCNTDAYLEKNFNEKFF